LGKRGDDRPLRTLCKMTPGSFLFTCLTRTLRVFAWDFPSDLSLDHWSRPAYHGAAMSASRQAATPASGPWDQRVWGPQRATGFFRDFVFARAAQDGDLAPIPSKGSVLRLCLSTTHFVPNILLGGLHTLCHSRYIAPTATKKPHSVFLVTLTSKRTFGRTDMDTSGGLESATVVESHAWFESREIASILTLCRRLPTSIFQKIYDVTWMRRSFVFQCSASVRVR